MLTTSSKDKIARTNEVKGRLKDYRHKLTLLDVVHNRIEDNKDRLDSIKSTMADMDSVRTTNLRSDDKISTLLDAIHDDEVLLKKIEIETRVISSGIERLDDEKQLIVKTIWMNHDMSMRDLADELHRSSSTLWRKSDEALLSLYDWISMYEG